MEEHSRIKSRMEGIDTIGEFVYVIQRHKGNDDNRAKHRRIEVTGTSEDGLGFRVAEDECEDPHDDLLDFVEPLALSQVSCSNVDDYSWHDMQSLLLSKEVQEKYLRSTPKLKKELQNLDLDNTLWNLRSWDKNRTAMVKLHFGERKKGYGGHFGDHSKPAIYNLMNNFKVSYIVSTLHAKVWYQHKGISYDDHL